MKSILRAIVMASLIATAGHLFEIDCQEPGKWVSFQSDDREVEFVMPDDYIVNVSDFGVRPTVKRTTVFAYENGVSITASTMRSDMPAAILAQINPEKSRSPKMIDFKFDRFDGKFVTYEKGGYEGCIYLATEAKYYTLRIVAASKDLPGVVRFLTSVRLGGKPFLSAKTNASNEQGQPLILEKLKNSSQVDTAVKFNAGKYLGKVAIEPLAAYLGCETDYSTRPPYLITSIYPNPNSYSTNFRSMDIPKGGDIKIKLQLMANGTVGDIIIYSDVDRSIIRAFAESAKKAKFVPASRNRMPVDACETVRLYYGVTVSSGIFTVK